jgi:hypothetical protein
MGRVATLLPGLHQIKLKASSAYLLGLDPKAARSDQPRLPGRR